MNIEISNQIHELRQLASLNLLAIRTILEDRGIPQVYHEMLVWNAEQIQARTEAMESAVS